MQPYTTPLKMKPIGDFFELYRARFKAPQATVEKAFAAAVFTVTGFQVPRECIRYTVASQALSLQIPSVLKTEIKFKKQEIFIELQKNLGSNTSPKQIF